MQVSERAAPHFLGDALPVEEVVLCHGLDTADLLHFIVREVAPLLPVQDAAGGGLLIHTFAVSVVAVTFDDVVCSVLDGHAEQFVEARPGQRLHGRRGARFAAGHVAGDYRIYLCPHKWQAPKVARCIRTYAISASHSGTTV